MEWHWLKILRVETAPAAALANQAAGTPTAGAEAWAEGQLTVNHL